jgi:hypothetical protein
MTNSEKAQCITALDELENWINRGYYLRDVYTDEMKEHIIKTKNAIAGWNIK